METIYLDDFTQDGIVIEKEFRKKLIIQIGIYLKIKKF